VQIDVENADTYDINYVDKNGEKKRPLILHASISGSIERVIYALLEKEAMRMARGEKAMLPVVLSPTQIRIIPVSEEQVKDAEKIMGNIDKHMVRVDIDDRDETLGKKIREAQKEWIPYIAVIGEKEIKSGKLTVTIRETNEKKEMKIKEIAELIEKQNKGRPFEKLSLPRRLTKRPII
jgi:threonyl-tRNA synthetase